ncbi:MAG: non-hydrolyzing UDP-N-acetylglucosamine 2-epimerase [Planctomycetaceae bacterium]
MNRLRTLLVFGTRPEAIKMAPVVQACRERESQIEPIVCVTGQHREMLAQVTDYFGIHHDVDLDVMQSNQTLSGLTARCIERIDGVLERTQPQCVVAQGDTTTVMCASLAAFYRRVPFVHVEAGLRTSDIFSPWPEEMNRRVASLSTALHCAPTDRSRQNLLREGIADSAIHVTGNTVIDALLWAAARERSDGSRWAESYSWLGDRRMVLITGHRRENFGGGFENICRAISELAGRFPNVAFLYPVHLNPNVQEPVRRILSGRDNVHLLPPAPYPEFVWLMDRSTLILTDSGGVQEEAPSLKKPILVMRDTTERPEALDAGAVELVGTDSTRIVAAVSRLLSDPVEYARRQIEHNPYGDGHAAARIVDLVLKQGWN